MLESTQQSTFANACCPLPVSLRPLTSHRRKAFLPPHGVMPTGLGQEAAGKDVVLHLHAGSGQGSLYVNVLFIYPPASRGKCSPSCQQRRCTQLHPQARGRHMARGGRGLTWMDFWFGPRKVLPEFFGVKSFVFLNTCSGEEMFLFSLHGLSMC